MRLGSRLAVLMLFGVSFAHLLRLIARVPIVVDGVDVPSWVSVFGCLVPGAIAALLVHEGRAAARRDAG